MSQDEQQKINNPGADASKNVFNLGERDKAEQDDAESLQK